MAVKNKRVSKVIKFLNKRDSAKVSRPIYCIETQTLWSNIQAMCKDYFLNADEVYESIKKFGCYNGRHFKFM